VQFDPRISTELEAAAAAKAAHATARHGDGAAAHAAPLLQFVGPFNSVLVVDATVPGVVQAVAQRLVQVLAASRRCTGAISERFSECTTAADKALRRRWMGCVGDVHEVTVGADRPPRFLVTEADVEVRATSGNVGSAAPMVVMRSAMCSRYIVDDDALDGGTGKRGRPKGLERCPFCHESRECVIKRRQREIERAAEEPVTVTVDGEQYVIPASLRKRFSKEDAAKLSEVCT
jgi:hypothetical protein